MGQRPGELERPDPRDAYMGTDPRIGRRLGTLEDATLDQSAGIDDEKVADTEQAADDPDLDAARAQIEHTRAEMSETIDAIQERLNPQVLVEQAKGAAQEAAQEKVEQAKDAIRQATIGKVEGAVSTATEKVQDVVHAAGDAISGVSDRVQGAVGAGAETTGNAVQSSGTAITGTGNRLLDTVKRHPLPSALAATGLGWLYLSMRKDNAGPRTYTRYSGAAQNSGYLATNGGYQGTDAGSSQVGQALRAVPDTAGQVASKAKESVNQLGSQATDQAQRARGGFERLLEENPLAVGAAVAGFGMLVGLAVPETEKENQMLGQARDSLMDRAGQAAQETAQRVQSVAQEAVSAAKQEAQNQELLPGS